MNAKRAVALLSGGLDGALSAKVVLQQSIEVIGINFTSPFFDSRKAHLSARELDIPLHVIDISGPLLSIIKRSRLFLEGGSAPCIECHALMLREAGKFMKEVGASFIITGEVVGEGSRSQSHRALQIVEEESNLSGYIVRPLSARLLPVTYPEEAGLLDRTKLLSLHGRSRKAQLTLARKWGITQFLPPSGGCLLTDPAFSLRVRDAFLFTDFSIIDVELLKIGRHFRLTEAVKVIVARDEDESERLDKVRGPLNTILKTCDFKGPTTVVRGELDSGEILIKAASLCAHYSNCPRDKKVRVWFKDLSDGRQGVLWVLPRGHKVQGIFRI